MDASIIEIGLISGFFGATILGTMTFFVVRRLKTTFFAEFPAIANQFVADLMNDAVAHPEKLKPVIDVLVNQGMGSLGISKATGPQSMKIGPLRVPMEIVQQFAPLLLNKLTNPGEQAAKKAVESVFG